MQLRHILLTCIITSTGLAMALPHTQLRMPSRADLTVTPSDQYDQNLHTNEPHLRVAQPSEIPFPLYPNGTRYRIGGKNGMKIVLFETSDEFSKVDTFYDNLAQTKGLSRKMLTVNYVQYSSRIVDNSEILRNTSEQPGIVIHEFATPEEAEHLGAAPHSKTNIIISFH